MQSYLLKSLSFHFFDLISKIACYLLFDNFAQKVNVTEKEFTAEWIEKLRAGYLKKFPDEFIGETDCQDFQLPMKNIHMGEELFGSYELIDSDGNSVLVTNSQAKAKYILYSCREKRPVIKVPSDEQELNEIVKNYEKHLDSLIRELEKQYTTTFPKQKNFFAISNNIFNSLNLKRY